MRRRRGAPALGSSSACGADRQDLPRGSHNHVTWNGSWRAETVRVRTLTVFLYRDRGRPCTPTDRFAML